MSTPEVSVIIPTCNRPKLLSAAIHSVIGQSFRDFEIVVVDDASDFFTADLVKSFQDNRVRWIRHEQRRGGAAARNTGIRNSAGEFVAFLDDDDEWHPEKLSRQVAVLKESSSAVGVIYTGCEAVDRVSGEVRAKKIPVHKGDLSDILLQGNCIGSTSSVLMRRQCFEVVGMFDESLPSFQDYDLWIRLSRVFQFEYIADCLLKYHLHSTKIWTNPEAIRRGTDMLLEKYGASPSLRKRCGGYYLSAAAQFCEVGDNKNARAALRRAILLDPYGFRPYLYYVLSLLSRTTYQRFQHYKGSLLSSLPSASANRFCGR
jgi:glycosyltransferase involved in cell wall biosynthesis